jgi:hypothetical protein
LKEENTVGWQRFPGIIGQACAENVQNLQSNAKKWERGEISMLVHVDNLIPGMILEEDIQLRAGGVLLTRMGLQGGRLDDKLIFAIMRFAGQLSPQPYMIGVFEDSLALGHLQSILKVEVKQVIRNLETAGEYPGFIHDSGLQDKVLRVIDKLLASPDLVKNLYEIKVEEKGDAAGFLLDHSLRVTLLAVAVGVKLRFSIVTLLNLGLSVIFHDFGVLRTRFYPDLSALDKCNRQELETFLMDHLKHSLNIFWDTSAYLPMGTRNEVLYLIANHHRPQLQDSRNKAARVLYLTDLVDEMVSPLPYKVRFNFSSEQLREIGERFTRRHGLSRVMEALIRLYGTKEPEGAIVTVLLDLFFSESERSRLFTEGRMRFFYAGEQVYEGYAAKLDKVLSVCSFDCAMPYPVSGTSLSRTIYCSGSLDPEIRCENLSRASIDIYSDLGRAKSFFKCAKLTDQLHELNRAGQAEAEKLKKEQMKASNSGK